MALTLEQIDACFDGLMPSGSGKSRYDIARAIEAEVRRQDTELIRQMLEALESVDGAMPFPAASQVLKVARARLGDKP